MGRGGGWLASGGVGDHERNQDPAGAADGNPNVDRVPLTIPTKPKSTWDRPSLETGTGITERAASGDGA